MLTLTPAEILLIITLKQIDVFLYERCLIDKSIPFTLRAQVINTWRREDKCQIS